MFKLAITSEASILITFLVMNLEKWLKGHLLALFSTLRGALWAWIASVGPLRRVRGPFTSIGKLRSRATVIHRSSESSRSAKHNKLFRKPYLQGFMGMDRPPLRWAAGHPRICPISHSVQGTWTASIENGNLIYTLGHLCAYILDIVNTKKSFLFYFGQQ